VTPQALIRNWHAKVGAKKNIVPGKFAWDVRSALDTDAWTNTADTESFPSGTDIFLLATGIDSALSQRFQKR